MFILLGIYALIAFVVIVALVYVLIKRLQDKDKENFEKRDN